MSVIVVKETRLDNFGNLTVIDEGGAETKVNAKHSHLHSLFEKGVAVSLTWKHYDVRGKQGEYVDDAKLVAEELQPTRKPEMLPEHKKVIAEAVKPKPLEEHAKVLEKAAETKLGESTGGMSKDDWAEKGRITRKSIERQKSLELAVEVGKLFGVEKSTTEKIIATAKRFEGYLETGADGG